MPYRKAGLCGDTASAVMTGCILRSGAGMAITPGMLLIDRSVNGAGYVWEMHMHRHRPGLETQDADDQERDEAA